MTMPPKDERIMHGEDVRTVVAEVLAEQKRIHNDQVDEEVLRTIATILTSFGIEEEDRIELRADFMHLRKWRKSVEQTQGLALKVIITAIISGIVGAFWLGFKT